MSSALLQLSAIISGAAATLDKACKDSGNPFPGMNVPFSPSSEAFRSNPEAAEAANIIGAAALQLAAMVLPAPFSMFSLMTGHLKSACIRVCLESNATEILREGGTNGVHVDKIAEIANISSDKMARVLRYLALHHVYQELSPNVFTNTRISSMLDTGKSVREILASPEKKHDHTPGFSAIAGHVVDEQAKAAAYLWETMSDPALAHSTEVNHTAFNRAFNWDGPLWTFLDHPDQKARQHRFGVGMQGIAAMMPSGAILNAFNWASLPVDSVVVDVGGGVGAASLLLARAFSHINIVLQDLPAVIEDAERVWTKEFPEQIDSGRVVLQAHNFFEEQPVKDASVFMIKNVIHNWSDAYATKILTKLRAAAQHDTKLIIIDSFLPYCCNHPQNETCSKIPGALAKEAQAPLLANYGAANGYIYDLDLSMLVELNALERTVAQLVDLLQQCGWRVTKIVRDLSCGIMHPVEAVPIF